LRMQKGEAGGDFKNVVGKICPSYLCRIVVTAF